MTRRYRTTFSRASRRYLERMSSRERRRIRKAIESLSMFEERTDLDVKRLGSKHEYRLRVGGFRVVFVADPDLQIIKILAVRPRGDAYRR
jgi:mRNA interferase RelE/StbE